jgi:type IV pilus biogenesis protein PilP
MSASRLAAWIFGFAVCTAWLASAAGVGRYRPSPRPAPRAAMDAGLTTLAADVQTQTARLRDRLAQAPAPSPAQRNPFSFAAPAAAPARPPVTPVATAPPVMPDLSPGEPTLTLIGVAEMPGAGGPVRTAMITGPSGELLMVTAGQTLAGRYEVAGIAADAVQLKDTSSGALRTLVLR